MEGCGREARRSPTHKQHAACDFHTSSSRTWIIGVCYLPWSNGVWRVSCRPTASLCCCLPRLNGGKKRASQLICVCIPFTIWGKQQKPPSVALKLRMCFGLKVWKVTEAADQTLFMISSLAGSFLGKLKLLCGFQHLISTLRVYVCMSSWICVWQTDGDNNTGKGREAGDGRGWRRDWKEWRDVTVCRMKVSGNIRDLDWSRTFFFFAIFGWQKNYLFSYPWNH